jgi:hypothetical protein
MSVTLSMLALEGPESQPCMATAALSNYLKSIVLTDRYP